MKLEDKVFTEKYRPTTLSEVHGQDEVVERLQSWTEDNSVPNLLLSGPAGVGKTASAQAFAREVFQDDWRANFLDFNASSERGIETVRNKIKDLASQSPSGNYQYKILFLDEVDSMTRDGQSALRRIMEEYSDVTRFFLSCNYSSRLIDPIKSRCVVLPYNRLDDSDVEAILSNILEQEGIEYEQSAIDTIIDYVSGDARRAVSTLQTSVKDGKLTEDLLDVVNRQVDSETVASVVDSAIKGEMDTTFDMVVNDVAPEIIDNSRFAKKLMREIQKNSDIPNDAKWHCMTSVGKMEEALDRGASTEVQIMRALSEIQVGMNASIGQYE